jgi:hypothetical protein
MDARERIKQATEGMPTDQRAEFFTLLLSKAWNRLTDAEWEQHIEEQSRLVRFAYAKPQPLKGY